MSEKKTGNANSPHSIANWFASELDEFFPDYIFGNIGPDLKSKLNRLFHHELFDEQVIDLAEGSTFGKAR